MTLARTKARTLVVVALALFIAPAGLAQPCDVVVDGGAHYSSVNDAVAALPDRDGHHLLVSGLCQETVEISGHRGLAIEGTAGATIEPAPDDVDPYPLTFTCRLCDQLSVRSLTIRGKPGVKGAASLWYSREVSFDETTIEGGGSAEGGLWVVESVGVHLNKVQVRNSSTGIRVDGPSRVFLVGAWMPGDVGESRVEGNRTGIHVNPSAALTLRGDTVVRDNLFGVFSYTGGLWVCCGEDVAHPRLEDNTYYGVTMWGGEALVQGPLTIRGNGLWGWFSIGTDADLWDVLLEENGSPGGSGGGIALVGGVLELAGGAVRNNLGDGVALWDGALGRLAPTEVRGNEGEGIDVQSLSLARVFSGVVVRDNGGFDLRCAPNAHGRGDKSGIGKLHCPGFGRSPDPVPGGPPR